jgi:hypothetical protein
MRHFEYLSILGGVRATQVVATLVDGMLGSTNPNNAHSMTYLLTLMVYRSCYRRYMALLGYNVQSSAMGAFIVEGEDGKDVDPGEYITHYTYYYKWKRDFPNLKVSLPVVI